MDLKKVVAWFFPEGALVAAALAAAHFTAWREPLARSAGAYAWAVLILGVALGLRFYRSRLLFTLLLLALAQQFLPHLPGPGAPVERAAFQAIAVLLPLNLAVFSLLPERGLFTASGLGRLLVILGQAIAAAAFVSGTPRVTLRALTRAIVPAGLTAWTPLSDAALVAFALAAALVGVALYFEWGSGVRPALWTLVASFLALHADPAGPLPTFYLATAGLLLVVGVVEASFLMAYRDGLTGLPSRRALNEALERLHGDCVVAMVDLDHFKQVNDRFGHDTGDQVLKMVASHLAGVAEGGRPFRYGGEEFALLFPGKTVAQVLPELDRVRGEVAAVGFAVRSRTRRRKKPRAPRVTRSKREMLTVTISIGVAKTVEAADRALYRAKEGGRNQVQS